MSRLFGGGAVCAARSAGDFTSVAAPTPPTATRVAASATPSSTRLRRADREGAGEGDGRG
ncbi:hypothetical protein [Kitasatospora purpeofusca]|uniref:hypothetical protein n=1 Tax=Kitasatospora purpeofusca TaxID=67352 RepID=UPI00365A3757